MHAPGSRLARLQGKETPCTLRRVSFYTCRARGWLARPGKAACTLAGQGAGLHTPRCRLARLHAEGSQARCWDGEPRPLSAGVRRGPRASPRWPVACPCQHVRNVPLAQARGWGEQGLGGSTPPAARRGFGSGRRAAEPTPGAVCPGNVGFVFPLQLCFSTCVALAASIPFSFFPCKYRQHPRGGHHLKYRFIMQIKPKPCPGVTGGGHLPPSISQCPSSARPDFCSPVKESAGSTWEDVASRGWEGGGPAWGAGGTPTALRAFPCPIPGPCSRDGMGWLRLVWRSVPAG